jgi:copper(I)-binding protein
MQTFFLPALRVRGGLLGLCVCLFASLVPASDPLAHDFRVGSIVIDHPYAIPSAPGSRTGAVYFRMLSNKGDQADRLISAQTGIANSAGIHRMQLDGDVMRMREIPSLDLPARAAVPMRHGQSNGHHLMLEGLKTPLKDGERFDLTLRFEKAGERTVKVWVQTPRHSTAHHH